MTDILSMINRLQDTAIDFTLSGRERDRDELHAARRAIMEAFEAKVMCGPELDEKALSAAAEAFDEANGLIGEHEELRQAIRAYLSAAPRPAPAPTELEVYGFGEDGRELKRPKGLGDVLSAALAHPARAAIHPSLEQEPDR